MKKKLLPIVFLVFCSFLSKGQTVSVPDPGFKAALIAQGVDANSNGEIELTEAAVVQSLNVANKGITDLTGIEAFVSLKKLDCSVNSLSSLPLASNLLLEEVSASDNKITSVDFTSNTALKVLGLHSNLLTSLNVSANVSLEKLYCFYNKISSLNVTGAAALKVLLCNDNLLAGFDVSTNLSLVELNCKSNPLTSLNVTQNTSLVTLVCAYGKLTTLDVTQNTALKYLYCHGNLLTSLDVSNNTALIELSVSDNKLTSLDVSKNTNLKVLGCYSNDLPSLDVTANTQLISLHCYRNEITELDLSKNTLLDTLLCGDNLFTSLDISNTSVDYLDIRNTPLQELFINEAQESLAASWNIPPSAEVVTETVSGIVTAQNNNSVTVYPVPAANVLHVASVSKVKNMIIKDAAGNTVLNADNQNSVSVSSLAGGTYFAEITTEAGKVNRKIVVE